MMMIQSVSSLILTFSVITVTSGGVLLSVMGAQVSDPYGCAISPDNIGCEMNRPFDVKESDAAYDEDINLDAILSLERE
ncbi:hypothetical protein K4A83_01280 [Spirulina subsalsa FACHB-351]|uniref:Uncharacterized protein n=1 Tax=Spirulina subsalsa FACHB-351 TaxID=234711 RepID=A0ABT3L082_9CYAN|nr:hypothetical protein [Spirulina subsalsa]MCW6034908.1 hypothetical protein [Spirulina subsalsa FACHB-351]